MNESKPPCAACEQALEQASQSREQLPSDALAHVSNCASCRSYQALIDACAPSTAEDQIINEATLARIVDTIRRRSQSRTATFYLAELASVFVAWTAVKMLFGHSPLEELPMRLALAVSVPIGSAVYVRRFRRAAGSLTTPDDFFKFYRQELSAERARHKAILTTISCIAIMLAVIRATTWRIIPEAAAPVRILTGAVVLGLGFAATVELLRRRIRDISSELRTLGYPS